MSIKTDYGDLFSRFFSGTGGRGGETGGYYSAEDIFAAAGNAHEGQADEEATLVLTLEKMMRGGKVSVQVQGRKLDISLPASVRDGQHMRLKGMGGTYSDGNSGDLYVTLRIKPDSVFTMEEYDLIARLQVAPWQAALGTDAKVRLYDGSLLNVKVPAGIGGGQKLRLSGKGLRKSNGSFGDLFVIIEIVIPRESSKKVQQLYRELTRNRLLNLYLPVHLFDEEKDKYNGGMTYGF